MPRFVCVGECMVELAALGDGTYRRGFAGDTFNTAWYGRRLLPPDWDVDYVTALGDDPVSDAMVSFMAGHGIGTGCVARVAGRAPGLYMIDLKDGERHFSYWRDRSAARTLADDRTKLDAAFVGADLIHFSGITLAILSPGKRRTLLDALAAARAGGAAISFDSNIRLRLWPEHQELREAIHAAARVTTIALPTVPDETDLFGEPSAMDVATRYIDAGAQEVIVRAGAGAATIIHGQDVATLAPVADPAPVDTTGAGDSFNAAYLSSRLIGLSPHAGVQNAHALASKVIRSHGALVEGVARPLA